MSSNLRVVACSLAVSVTAALIASPVAAAPDSDRNDSGAKVGSGDYLHSELTERGKNRRINAKRIGKGSVQGASDLRVKANKWNPHKKVRLAIAHSSDGTVAGFTGVTGRTVKASQVNAEIAKAESDQTAVSIDIVPESPQLMDSAPSNPGGGEYPQWALNKLQAEKLWAKTKGAGIKVAVLDTGVQGDHPDLAAQLLPGKDYVDPENTESVDPRGHGTHVAGIIAASMNDFGVTGLAPEVNILPVRVMDESGDGDWFDIIDAITYAADEGADVINMSFGVDYSDWEPLTLAVEYARLKGAALVASSGNTEDSTMMIPARTPGVIGVGGTTSDDAHVWDSNFNSSVDLSAPGEDIYSTYKDSGYLSDWGTSMAAAYVSATLALTLQAARLADTNATGVGVEQAVLDTSVDLGEPGRDDEFGVGRVNPLAAVQALLPVEPESTQTTTQPTPAPAKSVPAKKPARVKPKFTVKIKRTSSKKRYVTIRSRNAVGLKIRVVKKIRGKWRVQRTVVLRKNGKITLRLGVGQYRLKRNATANYYLLNKLFRVR